MSLGLVLLVQGFAVSIAPRASLSEDAVATVSTMTGMPCHGQIAAQADETGDQRLSCCDETCPDMTTCALGHLAPIAMAYLALPKLAYAEHGFTPVIAVSHTSGSLLRPPIAFHG